MKAFKQFLIRELIFTVIIAAIAYLLFSSILSDYYLPVFWVLLGVISLLTAVFHYAVIQIKDNQASKFTNRFMMVTGLKMMVYLAFITTYAFLNPEKATNFLISFFVLYLLYTFFEILLIVRYLKKGK